MANVTTVGSSSGEDSGEESGAESGDEPEEEEEQEADERTSFLISGKSVEEVRHQHLPTCLYVLIVTQACQTEQGLSDVAAAAEQLQPKGITLSTTKVTVTLSHLVYL